MKKLLLFFAFSALITHLLSCSDSGNGDGVKDPILKIEGDKNPEVAATASELTIDVISNISWTPTAEVDWLTIGSYDQNKFTVSISANPGDLRKGTVEVAGNGVEIQTLTVTQAGNFSVEQKELYFTRTATKAQTILVNDPLDSWEFEADQDWISGFKTDTGLDIYVNENRRGERWGTMVLKPEGRSNIFITVGQDGGAIDITDYEGRYRVTGTLLRESTNPELVPAPTEWECTMVANDDTYTLIVDHWAGVDASFEIRYSIEEDPLARFYLIMPLWDQSEYSSSDGLGMIHMFQPATFYETDWTNPLTGETIYDTSWIDTVAADSNPNGDNHESTMPHMELKYNSSNRSFTYFPPTAASLADGLHRNVGIGWRTASVLVSLEAIGLRSGFYTDVTFTKISDY